MNMRPAFPVLFFLLSICCTGVLGQSYNPVIDVQHYIFTLGVNDQNNKIMGEATVTLQFKQASDSFFLDLSNIDSEGNGMKVTSVKEGDRAIGWRQRKDHLIIFSPGKQQQAHTYTILYQGIPADGLIIDRNLYGHRGFFGDNWPNRAHNWLPCVDHPSDKATVEFRITAPDHYTVVANGALQEEKALPDHMKSTWWTESTPLSPKIMVVGIADFAVDHPGDTLGVPVYNYVYPENKTSGFRSYADALQILPFYIRHIGPYPFEKCGNVQSKTRFGGLENASAIFYFEKSVNDPGVESLMAHEIAHQWFGDAATETDWQHLWLSEGFATYMTHCYLENKYGTDTLKAGLRKDRKRVFEFEKKRMTPVVDTTIKEDYMQLLNPNSYQKGGWVLHMLRRKIGDSLFWKGISTYYATYRNHNASTEDLEKIMETASGQDLHTFFQQWLYRPGHPTLRLAWHYEHSSLVIETQQIQTDLFEFPLEFSIDGAPFRMEIKDRINQVMIPMAAKPARIIPDPDVNVLASFD